MSRHSKKRMASNQEQEQKHDEEVNATKMVCNGKGTEQSENKQQKGPKSERTCLFYGR